MAGLMLFDAARHEALAGEGWQPERVHDALQAIVEDMVGARLAAGHWPVHPLDLDGEAAPNSGFKSLYFGSAGVAWALWYLQRQGAARIGGFDALQAIEQAAAAYAAEPDTGEVVPSYFLGAAGIGLLQWRMGGDAGVADRLFDCVQSNIANPTNEALWAAPGTLVAAWHLWRATGQARWRELLAANAEQVWRTWLPDAATGGWLWTQDMYGRITQYLGAGHGFAGNVYALLKCDSVLGDERRGLLHARAVQTLARTARHDNGAVNWLALPGELPAGRQPLMQWCHGAPGIITAFADHPADARLDTLLQAGGEAIWRAGPLTKGPGLCHGTAGNGYAFLALHRRTGDSAWLARARAFAMHAIEQQLRMKAQHGQGRYSLWTGDAGVAVYLWHCLQGAGGLPGLEVID
jgi:hypothetical protein